MFRLADGGTVVFDTTYGIPTKVIDPYGQTTTITYNGFFINRVTEPGGRYLLFTYNGPQAGLVSRVEAHGLGDATVTDWVNYSYTSVLPGGNGASQYCLTRVDYSDSNPNNLNDNTHAHYTYEADNVPDQPTRGSFKFYPLVSTCNDPRYKGPMRRIAYVYENNGPHGAISAEQYSPSDGVKGVTVSSISPVLPSPLSGGAR
jgi:hypothetical protein